jgi:hypothetical protein
MPISISITQFHPNTHVLLIRLIPLFTQHLVGLRQQLRHSLHSYCVILVNKLLKYSLCYRNVVKSLFGVLPLPRGGRITPRISYWTWLYFRSWLLPVSTRTHPDVLLRRNHTATVRVVVGFTRNPGHLKLLLVSSGVKRLWSQYSWPT